MPKTNTSSGKLSPSTFQWLSHSGVDARAFNLADRQNLRIMKTGHHHAFARFLPKHPRTFPESDSIHFRTASERSLFESTREQSCLDHSVPLGTRENASRFARDLVPASRQPFAQRGRLSDHGHIDCCARGGIEDVQGNRF
jgi:hypothetical protein